VLSLIQVALDLGILAATTEYGRFILLINERISTHFCYAGQRCF
jgi:hypothetical protein